MKKRIVALLAILIAGAAVARTVYVKVGKVEYKACPATVNYVVKQTDELRSGIGLFSIKVKFGDSASAANTLNILEIDRISGQTNTLIGPEVFTNSFIYAPTPIFVAVGNTLRFENSETGADIDFAYEIY